QGLRVRTFQPGARAVSLLRLPGEVPVAALTPVEGGVFEAVLPAAEPFPYRYAVDRGEGPKVVEDPYSFQGALGELDHHLLGEGRHGAGHTRLGAHPRVLEGVEGVAFAVWAPEARRVSVVGDFNGWDGRRHPMRPHPNGVWDLFVPGVEPGARYKFEVLGRHGLEPLKADPFAFQAEPPPRSASVVHGLPDFPWTDQAWMAARRAYRPHRAPMSVYEVHFGSWRRREDGGFLSYRELARELVPYAVDLGFTHLELLPVMEHPFYGSWGYQPLALFAPTSRHGAPEDFAAFVDACHRAGLGVILDWVPAHFPEDGHGLARFDGSHLYEHADPRQGRHRDWNTLVFNFGRTEVQAFLLASAEHWLDRYHIDALRVDAVASMLYADYSRREGDWIPNRHGGRENLEAADFLRRANVEVYGRHPGVFTVAEESTAWPGVTRPVDHGGLGFGFKWNMGWMHDTLAYLARAPLFRIHHHDEITFSMLYAGAENFVLPLSHDEVVHGKGSLLSKMPGSRGERFANLRLLLAWQHAHGGKKLLFMGGEFGQVREWDHDASLDWALLQDGAHRGVQALVRDLNRLHRELPAMHEGDCEPWGFRWIDCGDRSHQVLAIHRQGEDPGEIVVAVLNFSGLVHRGYRLGLPAPGRWIEALNTDSRLYGGANEGNLGAVQAEPVPFHGQPWSAVLTVPALGAVFLRPAP
ncbi:MAG TPA: 1,4-alpha-glucan branching protein GlgB, partial [Holophagaceae bacterium]|nr:1,4-alpha-glucan branching protein GlgB [Holophagaceae bacterium]